MKKIILFATTLFTLALNAQNVGVGTNDPKSKLDIAGGLSLREGAALTLVNGNNDNIALTGGYSFYRITGPTAAFSLSGIVPTAGADGQMLTLVNTTAQVMTIKDNASGTASYSIRTLTGGDKVSVAGGSSVTLQYNKTDSRWYVTGSENFTVSTGSIATSDIKPGTNSAVTVTNGTGKAVGSGDVVLDVTTNSLGQKGIVSGPTGGDDHRVWGTDVNGNPGWTKVGNEKLTNSSVTVNTGTGLSGGGTVALGGTVTLNNTGDLSTSNEGALTVTAGTATTSVIHSNTSGSTDVTLEAGPNVTLTESGNKITIGSTNSGGTVTQVNTGAGLTGGPITSTGTISIPNGGVTNAMLANSGITVGTSGVGLSGGTTVPLGGTVTIASNATSGNTANTIVSRDGSGNFSAGLVSANLNGQWLRIDDRSIAPSDISSGYAKFGFTSWNNNNSAPYADFLHLRSYTDGSGGDDNLVMFRKDQIGMRIYQQTWNSATPYSNYKDVAFTSDITGAIAGTPNYVPKFTGANTLGNSSLTDDATTLTTTDQFDVTGGTGTNYITAPIEVRTTSTPRVAFHWPGVVASQIGMDAAGVIRTYNNPGTAYEQFAASTITANNTVSFAGAEKLVDANPYLNLMAGNNSSGGFHLYRNDGNSWGYFYGDNGGIGILKDGSWAIRATGSVNGSNSDVSFFTDGGAQRAYINSAGFYFTAANPYLNASSYYISPGGAYFNSGTVYTEAAIQARGGIMNDAGSYGGDLSVKDNLRIEGVVTGIQGTYPPNNAIRLTPNFHINSGAGYAVIANWDNSTTGHTQTLRIGNGSGSDIFNVYADGNTCIGSSAPEQMLDVRGNAIINTGGGDVALLARGGYGYRHHLIGLYPGWNYLCSYLSGYNYYNSGPDYTQAVYVGGGSSPLPIYAGGFYNWSSAKFKENITDLSYSNASEAISHLKPREFTWINSKQHTAGFIVEEVLPHVPDAIKFSRDGKAEAIDYSVLTTILIKAFQEQETKIKSLEKNQKVMASGVSAVSDKTTFIPFEPSFTNDISGKIPVVTISPIGSEAKVFIKEIDSDGFTVSCASTDLNPINITWIAIGTKANDFGVEESNYTPKMSYEEATSKSLTTEEIEKFRNDIRVAREKSLKEKSDAAMHPENPTKSNSAINDPNYYIQQAEKIIEKNKVSDPEAVKMKAKFNRPIPGYPKENLQPALPQTDNNK